MQIEKASLNDLEELLPVFDQYRIFYRQSSAMEQAKAYLSERLTSDDAVIWIARFNAQISGFTQIFRSYSSVRMGAIWILNDLFVVESARKNGIAEHLLKEATEFALENGKAIKLETEKSNEIAQKVYEKCNWKSEDRFMTYWFEGAKT